MKVVKERIRILKHCSETEQGDQICVPEKKETNGLIATAKGYGKFRSTHKVKRQTNLSNSGAEKAAGSAAKPVFQFGTNLSTSGAEKAAGSAAKPVFQFGTSLSTSGAEKAAGSESSAAKPVFQFGTILSTSGAEKAAGSAAFGHGLATNVGHEANLSQKAYVFSE